MDKLAKAKAISIYNNVLGYANSYDLLGEDWSPKHQNESAIKLSLIVAYNALNELKELFSLSNEHKEKIKYYEKVVEIIKSWDNEKES